MPLYIQAENLLGSAAVADPDGAGPLNATEAVYTINDTNAANNTATDVDQSAPLLTIRKTSVGGVDSFGFTGTNGVVTQTLVTAVAGTPPTMQEKQALAATPAPSTFQRCCLPDDIDPLLAFSL